MEFLGVGPLELFFILIIALIFLGPRDMVKTGRTMGKFMRKIVMSPTWRMVQQTSRELRTLPNRMIREAGMEEDIKDLDQLRKDMEKQIGTIRKPFSAAADDVNANLQAAQKGLIIESQVAAKAGETKPSETPATALPDGQTDLSAWTTAPPAAKPEQDTTTNAQPDEQTDLSAWTAASPAAKPEDDATAVQEPDSSGTPDQAALPSTEIKNPNAT